MARNTRKILVFQHVAFEILGTLNPLLKAAGLRIRYVNFGRDPGLEPSLEGYAGLIVLGGPMSVYDTENHPHLVTEVRLIQEALERGIAVLGICLGAQLLARALGAQVRQNPVREIGWYDVSTTAAGGSDPLLSQFQATEQIFQWHGDTFDIPDGAVHLATSATCAGQAFRYGDSAYGLQFHLEVDEHLIERWLTVPVHVRELEALHGQIDPQVIRRETRAQIARSRELSTRLFGEFIRILGPSPRRRTLPSR